MQECRLDHHLRPEVGQKQFTAEIRLGVGEQVVVVVLGVVERPHEYLRVVDRGVRGDFEDAHDERGVRRDHGRFSTAEVASNEPDQDGRGKDEG